MENKVEEFKLKVKVEQMWGKHGPVKNQFIIRTQDGTYFQSYETVIAFIARDGKTYLDEKMWDYSLTTGKYRNRFLGDDNKKETEKKIKFGEYTLVDLN